MICKRCGCCPECGGASPTWSPQQQYQYPLSHNNWQSTLQSNLQGGINCLQHAGHPGPCLPPLETGHE